jgi:hypothetical protein
VGWVDISLKLPDLRKEKEDEFEKRIKEAGLQMGGNYKPTNCRSRHKVAIVVPYRNRKDQLIIFLRYMHPFLQRQQLEYVIFIVEQSGKIINNNIKSLHGSDKSFKFSKIKPLKASKKNHLKSRKLFDLFFY